MAQRAQRSVSVLARPGRLCPAWVPPGPAGSDVPGSLGDPGRFFPCFSGARPGPGGVCGAAAWLGLAVMSVSMEGKKTEGLPDLEEY